jgi:hypothetical protein
MTDEGKFDSDAWIKDVTRYEKNKNCLNCSASVKIDYENHGRFIVELQNVQPKYEKALSTLVEDICSGAIQWLVISFTYPIAEEDTADEKLKINHALRKNAEKFINILLQKDFIAFKNTIRDHVAISKTVYELSHLKFINNKWFRWNGDIWDGKKWYKKDNNSSSYQDDVSKYIESIVKVK